ncbi:hypothetical protein [Halalkalibacter alkalisediminis]|uniref:Lipoyl-binding domain-containing protein n=1 Tax=Halalkalibacter alkalisediminis TaxID=935616 RepID=A0ABV6NN68_9BACI|nr:hypothetical protein [Halalkalibacter alkalisediminis]
MKVSENILSTVSGKVVSVLCKESKYVYEWEPLIEIVTNAGSLEKIVSEVGGTVTTLFVLPGTTVKNGTNLACIDVSLVGIAAD